MTEEPMTTPGTLQITHCARCAAPYTGWEACPECGEELPIEVTTPMEEQLAAQEVGANPPPTTPQPTDDEEEVDPDLAP